MLFALGAASSAVDLLSSLVQGPSGSSSQTPTVPSTSNTFSVANPSTTPTPPGAATSQPTTASLNTLLAAQTQGQASPTSRSAALQDLFSLLDTDGDGKISKAEFENALGAGGTNLQAADQVFAQLDKNGDGSISLGELSQGLQGAGHHHHGHHHAGAGGAGGAGGGGGANGFAQSLQGATSNTATNADGSTTTTLTYADGTTVTLTQPAASSASANTNASASYNFTERLIQREAQAIAANAQSSVSLSA